MVVILSVRLVDCAAPYLQRKRPARGGPIVNIGAEARLFPLVPVSMLSYVLLPLQR